MSRKICFTVVKDLAGVHKRSAQDWVLPASHNFCRNLTTTTLTPRISLISNGDTTELRSHRPDLSKYRSEGRPLGIILPWLLANNKAVMKYAKLYLDKGFDVLTISMSAQQLLWPPLYEPVVQREILPALLSSDHAEKILHSFSVGGFIFSRIQKHTDGTAEGERLFDTIKAQIYDSMADISSLKGGCGKALFENSPFLQNALSKYIDLHLNVSYNKTMKYYLESKDYFYNKPVKHAPALFFSSEADYISPPHIHKGMIDTWSKESGIRCEHKVWADTTHVGHMRTYPEEYQSFMWRHLKKSGLAIPHIANVKQVEKEITPRFESNIRVGRTSHNELPNIVYSKAVKL